MEENKIIERILNNKDLCSYLDDEDWVNFWLLFASNNRLIDQEEFNEFKKLIPQAFVDLKISKVYYKIEYETNRVNPFSSTKDIDVLATTDVPDLNIKQWYLLNFLDKESAKVYLDKLKSKQKGKYFVKKDSNIYDGVYLRVSNIDDIYIRIFFIKGK